MGAARDRAELLGIGGENAPLLGVQVGDGWERTLVTAGSACALLAADLFEP